ncbi:MAG: response regulator [Candidatus Omnitrophica bacterium]|nr:response regulator [Candidatus Omnitrophota bacterium]
MKFHKTILVVDDEEGLLHMYAFLLEPLGFELESVENGLEAVKKIEIKEYDVVLMDTHMPVMSGHEALAKIKQIRPSQKVIMFSSLPDPEKIFESRVLKEGAVSCLYKPVDLVDIQLALEKVLGPLPTSL